MSNLSVYNGCSPDSLIVSNDSGMILKAQQLLSCDSGTYCNVTSGTSLCEFSIDRVIDNCNAIVSTTTINMPRYSVGEKIEYINEFHSPTRSNWHFEEGEEFIVMQNGNGEYELRCTFSSSGPSDIRIFAGKDTVENKSNFTSLSFPKNTMQGIKDFARGLILGEPEKTLQDTGLKNKDGTYTEAARELYLDFMMKKDEAFKTYLVETANAFAEEKKKECNKCC